MTWVGQHVGRYKILEQVGSGGMSVVYRGLDTALEREVAVKVLHPHLACKAESRKRLAREAKAVAKLQHPNILEVFDFASVEEREAYIVTEYIHGQTLAEFASHHAFHPPEIAAMVVHEVASALAHAHEAGVIHRDLKPENVMIRNDGVIKLMDFGIAKVIDRDDRMTITGALVGSPAHMAPEIIEGEEAGAEADVFSLGTILYYLTTGQLPFIAQNTTALLKRILDAQYEDPRRLVPSISDELTKILKDCLARAPSERTANAGKLREALEDYLAGLGLTRVSDELAAFFADPETYQRSLTDRLCHTLVDHSHRFAAAKRPAKALACLNQVLALNPAHPPALAALDAIHRSQRRHRSLQRRWTALAGVVALALLAAGGYLLRKRLSLPPDYHPLGNRLNEVILPQTAYLDSLGERTGKSAPSSIASPTRALPIEVPEERPPFRKKVGRSPPAAPVSGEKLVPFVFQFRPYAYASVDGAEPTPELPHHELMLSPGQHRLTFGCRFCKELTETFDVPADGTGLLRLQVQPKTAFLKFSFLPKDATIELLGQRRTAQETESQPFEVKFPLGVTSQRIEFEVRRPGFRPSKDSVLVQPGNSQTVQGSLVPE